MKTISKQQIWTWGCILALAVSATGCRTANKETVVTPEPVTVPVALDIPEEPIEPFQVRDRNNPKEVIRFGISLADQGRHDAAARVFLDAAERFVSKDRRLEQALLMAAVKEHWLGGNLGGVRRAFAQLEGLKERDVYDRASEDESIRKIRKLVMSQ